MRWPSSMTILGSPTSQPKTTQHSNYQHPTSHLHHAGRLDWQTLNTAAMGPMGVARGSGRPPEGPTSEGEVTEGVARGSGRLLRDPIPKTTLHAQTVSRSRKAHQHNLQQKPTTTRKQHTCNNPPPSHRHQALNRLNFLRRTRRSRRGDSSWRK